MSHHVTIGNLSLDAAVDQTTAIAALKLDSTLTCRSKPVPLSLDSTATCTASERGSGNRSFDAGSITVNALANLLVVVVNGYGSGGGLTALRLDDSTGPLLTELGAIASTSSTRNVQCFYLANPPSGTHTFFGEGWFVMGELCAYSLIGSDAPTFAAQTPVRDTTNTPNLSMAVSIPVGGMAIDGRGQQSVDAIGAVGSDQTAVHTQAGSSEDAATGGVVLSSSFQTTPTGATAMEWTIEGGAAMAVVVAPGAVGGGGGEPMYTGAPGQTLVVQDDMTRYTDVTSMGTNPPSYSAPWMNPQPSPYTSPPPDNAVDTTHVSLITPGRGGAGQALRLSYDGVGFSESHNFVTKDVEPQPVDKVNYVSYWFRFTPASGWPSTDPLAVKWCECWHVNSANTRIQFSTRYKSSANTTSKQTVWMVIDQGESSTNGDQSIGPYLEDLDTNWHRFTYAIKCHASAGNKDGFAKAWLDGTQIIDVEQSMVGVTPSGGTTVWCSQDDVDHLAIADGIANINFGGPQTTVTGAWTLDIDDLTWWNE